MIKKILLTLPILFIAFFTYSQIEVNIDGFVNFPDGTPLATGEIQVVAIGNDTTPIYNEILPITDGEFDGSFTVDDPNTQGIVLAQMEDCNGDTLRAFGFWIPADSSSTAIIDIMYCDTTNSGSCYTYLSCDPTPTGQVILVPETFGVPPFTYEWNTGETTDTIIVTDTMEYCVTVTDALGCASEACMFAPMPMDTIWPPFCFGFIGTEYTSATTADLTASPLDQTGTGYSYLWTGPNGFTATDQTVSVTNEGLYCVTMTSTTDSCVIDECIDFYHLQTDSCFVYIVDRTPNVPTGDLHAFHTGFPPYTYLWNTGDTTESITPTEDGEYCVTVVDNFGCEADACIIYEQNPFDSCFAFIYSYPTPQGYQVSAYGEGWPPFTYQWSNGESTQNIVVTEDGEYCVTVTDANGCVAEACEFIDVDTDICYTEIYQDSTSNGSSATFTAETFGTGPFTY
ncbi:MAG: hypothetical protein AAGK97_04500, partial [Bacteroidota bacterium]